MAFRYKLEDYTKIRERDIFVDANVLIYLFWPTGSHFFERSYAHLFRNLLRQGNKLFVDIFIISEVINRVIRTEHKKNNPASEYKEFRKSSIGRRALNDVYIIIKNYVLNHFQVIGKNFNCMEISSFLIVDELDFVDKVIMSVCKENNLVLLTNDADFKNSDLDIISGNPKIFDK